MLPRQHPARRRPGCNIVHLCAASAGFLLLISLSVLHSRLSSSPTLLPFLRSSSSDEPPANPLSDDAFNDAFDDGADDRIDELDVIEDDDSSADADRHDDDEEGDEAADVDAPSARARGLFFDHASGSFRLSFGGTDLLDGHEPPPYSESGQAKARLLFSSDDEPVDEEVRRRLHSVRQIEDLLLLKRSVSGDELELRKGWAAWLEGKADYLRRDRMLRSNLDQLNPKNHLLLQDPDASSGVTGLTRGDRTLQAALWKEILSTPLVLASHQAVKGVKRVEHRRILRSENESRGISDSDEKSNPVHVSKIESRNASTSVAGRRWGYFPGLDLHLSFSEFMDQFLGDARCGIKVFMVWNSPPWMYSVRYQRGLESLLYHNGDACVVVFSETMELDFFSDFVKDGFRIAVVMPNLDELLRNTHTHVFASVWFEWKNTKFYALHCSELVRLASLYKYGGIYLDSDIIVLRPLYTLNNSIGVVNHAAENPSYNGAVMSFPRHSSFLKMCLEEFHATYDDTKVTWNGADLITRVVRGLMRKEAQPSEQLSIKIEPSLAFFPISSYNITRYFATADEGSSAIEAAAFRRIINESITFHFWNSLTSKLVPQPGSLVERLLNLYCLRCLDIL